MSHKVRNIAWMMAVCLGLLCHGQRGYAQQSTYEQLQAAYIFNFAKYIQWPKALSNLVVGVHGEGEIATTLENILAGKKAGTIPVSVQRVGSDSELLACHIIFLTHADSRHVREIVSTIRGKSILLVTEDDLIRKGAMISFVIDDQRLKFKLKHSALTEAQLVPSEGLLKLAIVE